jgi:hypothetical protein
MRKLFTPPLNLILLIFTFACMLKGYSQNHQQSSQTVEEDLCGIEAMSAGDPLGVYSYSIDPADLNAFDSKTLNIFYWRINKDDGSYDPEGLPLNLNKVKESVRLLNYYYNPFNICFNLIGMGIINSTAHHDGSTLTNIHNYAISEQLAKQDAINVYVPYRLSQGAGVGSYNNARVAIISNIVGSGNNTLPHEIGHMFNLAHTFDLGNTRPSPTNCERVTRNPNNPYFNAYDAGDRVLDTNAVPNFYREQANHGAYAIEAANVPGFTNWLQRRNVFLTDTGFNDELQAAAIEQALIDYGFTTVEIQHLKFNKATSYAYQDVPNCAYAPDSRVNDPNSPFFKNCVGTPYTVVQSDINNMLAYASTECERSFTIGQGIRMHESIEYDANNEFTQRLSNQPIDLLIKDMDDDIGQEPNVHTTNFWNSTDIWVRNQNDGIINQEHENPEYDPNSTNYVYIRVSNKGCGTSSGSDTLKLYWAKASTSLAWPEPWDGTVIIDNTGQNVLMGDEIDTQTIPSIQAGEDTILEIPWATMPDPANYTNINGSNSPWHFCLLARIESNDDPITFPEGSFLTDNVKENNNLAWKNITVVDVFPNTPSVAAAIAVSNPNSVTTSFSFEFIEESITQGKALYNEAEVTIEMDSIFYNAWGRGGSQGYNLAPTRSNQRKLVTDNNARFDNVVFNDNELGILTISFNFLIDEMTTKEQFTYHILQKETTSGKLIGGETFIVNKQTRDSFDADSGDDKTIERNESTTLSAEKINEAAIYNWYNPDGTLIYTGPDVTVSPDITKTYKLEVISDVDGYKDYDEITVNVAPYRIETLVPNPVIDSVIVNYVADQATSAYLMVLGTNNNTANNYILDTTLQQISIDVSSYPVGVYIVALVCDGNVVDTKNLSKQ